MHLSRLATLFIGVTVIAGCDDDVTDVTTPPPLAGVRFINSLSDTGAVDIRVIDQVAWSPVGNALAFRAGTEHQPTEAKDRRFRVFPTSTNPAIASQILLDTTLTFTAGSKYTLLLTGSARSNTERFVVINDDHPTPAANQIAVRAVNAATGAIDAYFVNSATDPIASPPSAANLAPLAASAYITRATAAAALRVTNAGSATVTASAAGPTAATPLPGQFPAAGVNSSGTAFSVYYFPAGVSGSVNAPTTGSASCTGATPLVTCNPTVIWFVDRVPLP